MNMKKILLCITGMAMWLCMSAQVQIQGQPYHMSKAKRAFSIRQQMPAAANESTFTFADIVNWSGSGANPAAVAIQWNSGTEKNALVWGYRWDGKATGEMMLRAIAKADPRFFVMSEEGTGYGSTIAGLGYDVNGDGDFAVVLKGKVFEPNEEGVILVKGYGYDGYVPADPDDYWQSGWYQGYWSYWVKESSEDMWGYSSLGATNRELVNGCWDGWNFAVNMMAADWLPLAPAAPSTPLLPTPPAFKSNPQSITTDPGADIVLTVKVKGENPSLQWYKDGVKLPEAIGDTCKIPNARTEDSGAYYCVATNSLGSATSEKAIVKIGPKEGVYSINEAQEAVLVADQSYYAFVGSLTIPAQIEKDGKSYPVTQIAPHALEGLKNLTSVTLPASVKTVGAGAFKDCPVLYEIILGENTKVVGDSVCMGCETLLTVDFGKQLTHIGKSAFEGCGFLSAVLLPDTMEEIGEKAFYQCGGMEVLQLGNGIRSVGKEAFYYCDNLTEMTIPKSLTQIGEKAFSNLRKVKSVRYLLETERVPDYLFYNWVSLTSVELPATVKQIGKYAFYYCSALTEVRAPGLIEEVDQYAFYNCSKLKTLKLGEGLQTIGQYAFYKCALLDFLAVPTTVRAIGKYAFYGCVKLEKATLSGDIVKVEDYTFRGCSNLKSVVLGAKLKNIGSSAFAECSKLAEIYYNCTEAPGNPGSSAFSKVPVACKAYVPKQLEDKFKANTHWGKLTIVPVADTEAVFWIGEGNNCATLAISWQDHKTPATQLWGYRWSEGNPTVAEMLQAIVAADPRLFSVVQMPANTVCGLGYDLNGKNTISMIVNGDKTYPKYHATGQFTATDGNYNGWVPADEEDHWNAPTKDADLAWTCYQRNGFFGWDKLAGEAAATPLLNNQSLHYVFHAENWEEWKRPDNFVAVQPYKQKEIDYTKGIFVVNEDWFGWDYGTVNFLTADDEMIYRSFRRENPGEHLGITTQFGTIYGDRMYLVSKQPNMSGDSEAAGGRLVVADAQTLKKTASFNRTGEGDGRSFLGVDEHTGYIGTSAGIVLFDLEKQQTGELIAGTGGGSLYSGQIGNMARLGNYVFALKQKVGVLVIDAAKHEVVNTVDCPNASMLTPANDGKIWVALSGDNKLMKIDPVTFETAEVVCPAGVNISNSWGAWNAGNLCAATDENALYLAAGSSFSLTTIVKYDIDKNSFQTGFFTLPDQDQSNRQILYGAGMRFDPASRQLVVTATESGYGAHYQKNWIHFVDSRSGALIRTVTPENYYWFPAVTVFPDNQEPEIKLEQEINIAAQPLTFSLNELASDADNLDAAIIVTATCADEAIAIAEFDYPTLTLKGVTTGVTTLSITANSNGKVVHKEIPLNVTVATELDETLSDLKVSVYPNPARDYLTVQAPEESKVSVYDLSGRLVRTYTATFAEERIEISSLAAGMYTVRVQNTSGSAIVNFIKE